MSQKNAGIRPIVMVKSVDQFTPVFESLSKPLGLWRAFPVLTETSIFSYSYDLNWLTTFTNNIHRHGRLQPVPSEGSTAFVAIFSDVMWKSSVWKANMEGGSDPGPLIFTYQGLKDDWNSYYLGWIKFDAAISDGSYPVQLPSDLLGAICIQDGPYMEFYSDSLDFCRSLVESGFYQRTCEYKYINTNIKTKLHCTPCLVCCGVHREDKRCPFLPSPSIDFDVVKHYFKVSEDVIVRDDLASNVINFVSKEHFLLIQAPSCTGKTMLLRNIGLLLLEHSIHTALAIHYSEGRTVSEITPIIAHNAPRLYSPEDLMNHLSSPSRPKGSLWLLIDECQLTYMHRKWWGVLYRPPFYHPDLYVVAAGSFGSHYDPRSHSPPIDVPQAMRMPLFPGTVPNENLFLAFTEAHLERFLRGKNPVIDKNIIIEYASPVCQHGQHGQHMRFGVHPGVVSNLVRFLGTQATKYPFKTKAELMDAFCRDSEVVFNCPHSLDIERCLPRPLPSGFSPIWMLMFSTVFWHGYVEVPILARGIPEVVVENSYGPLIAHHTSPLFFGVVHLSHLLKAPTTNADFACIAPNLRPETQMAKKKSSQNNKKNTSHALTVVSVTPKLLIDVREYVIESYIARTPRERFELYPSDTSKVYHPGDRHKPYSSRQMVHSSLPLTDFEQAAHDARQLGWLLELPSSSRPTTHCKLVLPSQWHFDYLEKTLMPKTMMLPETVSLDEFILMVLKSFNGPYLLDYLNNQGTIRERVYEMEFYRCAHRIAGACFLTPQARTADGTGYADFVVRSREWIIEVFSEGDRMKNHKTCIANTGKYHKEWPKHTKRVVDFRANIGTPRTINDKQYIAVRVIPPSANRGPLRHQRVQMVMCTASGETPFTLV